MLEFKYILAGNLLHLLMDCFEFAGPINVFNDLFPSRFFNRSFSEEALSAFTLLLLSDRVTLFQILGSNLSLLWLSFVRT